ncbi:MAG: hypothetical protein ACXVQ7_13020 [Actinomycetota bacterium]
MEEHIVLRYVDQDHKVLRARELVIPEGVVVPMLVVELSPQEFAIEVDVEGEHPLEIHVKDENGRVTEFDPIWPGHHIRLTP